MVVHEEVKNTMLKEFIDKKIIVFYKHSKKKIMLRYLKRLLGSGIKPIQNSQ